MLDLPKKLKRIDVDEQDDVMFIFADSGERFSAGEFTPGSLTRMFLERIEYEIHDYNSEVEILTEDDV